MRADHSPTLEELGRVLGGAIRQAGRQTWLDTTVDGLKALVVRTEALRYDLVVLTPWDHVAHARIGETYSRPAGDWLLDGDSIPRFRDPYVFLGCRGGVLSARALGPASLETIRETLAELAVLARLPWGPADPAADPEPGPFERLHDRIGFVLLVALLVALVR